MTDFSGLKQYGEAFNHAVHKTFNGVESFLSSTCKPALDELGLMLQDKVRYWRLKNILQIIEKSKGIINFDGSTLNLTANPKVVLSIIENGSNEEDEELQEMWAGLFASCLSENGKDDSNVLFVNLLKQISSNEAKLLKILCDKITVTKTETTFHYSTPRLQLEEVLSIIGSHDKRDVESLILHMTSLNILTTRMQTMFSLFYHGKNEILITHFPSILGLQLFMKCQGYKGTIDQYLQSKLESFGG